MMIKWYQEITLLPNSEISLAFLWTKVYTQLHLAFVSQKDTPHGGSFAVSFPEYAEGKQKGLGHKVRVFAETEDALQTLDLDKALERLLDYVHLTPIHEIPMRRLKGYAIYSRQHAPHSREQVARRFSKRHGLPIEQVASRLAKKPLQSERLVAKEREDGEKFKKSIRDLPYIQMQSLTNRHKYNLFIHKQPTSSASASPFSFYGLSPEAAVPEF